MINRMQKWIYVIILLTGYSIRSYTQKTINLNIPVEQNWMFDNEHPVRFMLELTSAQSGFSDRIRMDIATDFGNAVSSTFITYSFGTDSIAPGGGFRSRASVTLTNLTPGFYQVCFIAGTDTLKHFFFGYEAEQILSKPDGPPNLKRFWNKTITELKRVHPAYKMTRLPESSKPERDVYEVEMRSLEGEILRGYWAVPTDEQLDEFTKETGIEVVVNEVGWDDIREKMVTAAAGGQAVADVVEVDWSWVGEFYAADWLEPLDVSDEVKADMPTLETFTKDGKVLAIPYANDYRLSYYNTEQFEKAGITEEPQTWEDVLEACRTLKSTGTVEHPLQCIKCRGKNNDIA